MEFEKEAGGGRDTARGGVDRGDAGGHARLQLIGTLALAESQR